MLTAFLLSACGSLTQSSDPYGAKIGQAAPEFRLETPTGERVKLSDYEDRPRVIYFWASWCGSCTFELPLMQEFATANAAEDLVVMTVNVGEDPAFVESYLQEHTPGYTFVAMVDPLLDTFKTYRILAFPTTFFIGDDGTIQQMKMGRIAAETLGDYSSQIR